MSDKPFLTYEQQIELLKGKNLIIPNDERAINLLKEHSYFALVCGYKNIFKSKNGSDYAIYTTFDDILRLYYFDNDLRKIFFEYILKVEIKVKSLLSYYFTEKFGDLQQGYLNVLNYDYDPRNNKKTRGINKLTHLLDNLCNQSTDYLYITFQRDRHKNVPLWVIMKALSFGSVSKMYSFLKSEVKTKISKEFPRVAEKDLGSFIDLLSTFRNVCAHNERLYDFKCHKRSIPDTEIHGALSITKRNSLYLAGKNDLFSAVIVLKYLLSNDDFGIFYSMLSECIYDHLPLLKNSYKNKILKALGFPNKWEDIIRLNIDRSGVSVG